MDESDQYYSEVQSQSQQQQESMMEEDQQQDEMDYGSENGDEPPQGEFSEKQSISDEGSEV